MLGSYLLLGGSCAAPRPHSPGQPPLQHQAPGSSETRGTSESIPNAPRTPCPPARTHALRPGQRTAPSAVPCPSQPLSPPDPVPSPLAPTAPLSQREHEQTAGQAIVPRMPSGTTANTTPLGYGLRTSAAAPLQGGHSERKAGCPGRRESPEDGGDRDSAQVRGVLPSLSRAGAGSPPPQAPPTPAPRLPSPSRGRAEPPGSPAPLPSRGSR